MRGLPISSSTASLTSKPYFRPVLIIFGVLLVMQALKSSWSSMSRGGLPKKHGGSSTEREKLVVAHFMLGNTYPFTPDDWTTTFNQAEETGLDALALNIGPEEWQFTQALSAFNILQTRPARYSPPSGSPYSGYRTTGSKLKLFISMDMNVLPSSTVQEGEELKGKMLELMKQDGYLYWEGRKVLSTFSGHGARFGGMGWAEWLNDLNRELGEKVFFWPSFFLPPDTLKAMPFIDGIFNWNAAWPLTNKPPSLLEDEPFLPSSTSGSQKAYMTSVSPLFFTHYGSTGPWAWNKNFIFSSDNLLYPTRWSRLLSLPERKQPDIIQVISWNDFGESHYIAPVLGAQPGCEKWTDGMDHEAFREMTAYWIDRWRFGDQTESRGEGRVWIWYRTHPKDLVAKEDEVGRPERADWTQDLINIAMTSPTVAGREQIVFRLQNEGETELELKHGKLNTFTIPFKPGRVELELDIGGKTVWRAEGREIDGRIERYNFNMWSGSWRVELQ